MPKEDMDEVWNGAWGHFPGGVALNTHSGFYFTSLVFLFLPWNKDDDDKKGEKKEDTSFMEFQWWNKKMPIPCLGPSATQMEMIAK